MRHSIVWRKNANHSESRGFGQFFSGRDSAFILFKETPCKIVLVFLPKFTQDAHI